MADVFDIQIVGLQELIIKLTGETDGAMQGRIREAITWETQQLEAQVKQNISNLFQNPDRMLASISSNVDSNETQITGTVTASGLPYLKIQEYGGTVQTPEIVPVNATILAFMAPAKLGFGSGPKTADMVFTKKTAAHATTLPERSFMRRSLAQKKEDIISSIQMAARLP